MTSTHAILRHIVPTCDCAVIGEPSNASEYAEAVIWRDERPQPTWADVEAAKAAVDIAEANAEAEANRRIAFQLEADPLFFGWQRGENTEQAWRDKCDEIRERFPYQ